MRKLSFATQAFTVLAVQQLSSRPFSLKEETFAQLDITVLALTLTTEMLQAHTFRTHAHQAPTDRTLAAHF